MDVPFSIATNACAADDVRIVRTVPSWLRVLGDRVTEVVVVVDEQPPSGRIALLHGEVPDIRKLYEVLRMLVSADSRVRYGVLDDSRLESASRKWFGRDRPVRCQAGTPIFAMIQAFEAVRCDLVMRADCDMLFHGDQWLEEADRLLAAGTVDLVEPPRLGWSPDQTDGAVSTRALVLRREDFASRCLPLVCRRLDPLRRLHRWFHGRPPWLALEQSLDWARRQGRIRHRVLDTKLGYSLHVAKREDAEPEWFATVVHSVEQGELPEGQRAQRNYMAPAWRDWASKARAGDGHF